MSARVTSANCGTLANIFDRVLEIVIMSRFKFQVRVQGHQMVTLACIGFVLSVDELYRDTPLLR
jgi:hypothetical protein